MTSRRSFGSIRKRADTGRWQARWQDPSGHQHSKDFATKTEASDWLDDANVDRRRGTWTDPRDGRVTFADWQAQWRATIVNLRPSTLTRDLGYIDRYLLPAFESRPLVDIDHMEISAWIAALLDDGLAPATVAKAGQLMATIMRTAVVAKRIAASPCTDVALPKPADEETMFLTAAQVGVLADVVAPAWRAVILLAAYSGLRAGELFGLTVQRVDLLHRRITVAEILTEVEGHLYHGAPKTRAGRRVVPIPRFVAEALEPHLAGKADHELVFTDSDGGYVRLSNWRVRVWRPALAATGLEGLRIHDLRHTAVSLWIAAGVEPKEVARRAGHRSVVTVYDRYGHLYDQADSDPAMDRLEAMAPPPRPGGRLVSISSGPSVRR